MRKTFIGLTLLVLLFSGCQNELTVSPKQIVLYHEKTVQLEVEPSGSCSFESKDTFHATVDKNGLVTGEKIGSTEIVVTSGNKSVSVPITVKPLYILYDDMEENIGKTQAEITSIYGTPYKTATTSKGIYTIAYKNVSKYAEYVGFSFEDGKCSAIVVMVPVKYMSQMSDYLLERYLVASVLNDEIYMIDKEGKVVIQYELYETSYMSAMYVDSEKVLSSKSSIVDYSKYLLFDDILDNN